MKEPVLVLGGGTFMGRATVDRLKHDYRVILINRGRPYWGGVPFPELERTEADRRDPQVFSDVIQRWTRKVHRWKAVIDFSAFNSKHVDCSLSGLDGAYDVYIFISSDSVYEVCAGRPFHLNEWNAVREMDAVRPHDPEQRRKYERRDSYGAGKIEVEDVLRNTGRPVFCFRLPDVIGPYDDTGRLWAYWFWLQTSLPIPVGDSTQQISFVFSEDVAELITLCIRAPPPDFVACNVGSGMTASLQRHLELFAAVIGANPPAFLPEEGPSLLPSVERFAPLDFHTFKNVFPQWKPTSSEEIFRKTHIFFKNAERYFPNEASLAARKLPRNVRALTPFADVQSESTDSSSDSASKTD
eukprot:GEMP01023561.1.p1 GENE.GEMP01023561.1~~GEMP01023561.1.p1  ORF type:complete len:355 (+),score=81.21 GEMP01023561.1:39-1103(+)